MQVKYLKLQKIIIWENISKKENVGDWNDYLLNI
jgi:hypothetical protein